MKNYIKTTFFSFITVGILLPLLFSGCNKDGVGIYYSISKEEKQINSKISELPVHQVVEVGTKVYALTGRSIWEKEQSGSSWNDIGNGYDIVAYEGGADPDALYAFFNKDDSSLEKGILKELDIDNSVWSEIEGSDFDDKGKLIDIGDNTYALRVGKSTDPQLYLINDLSTNPLDAANKVADDDAFAAIDGTFLDSSHYIISDTDIYSCSEGSLTDISVLTFSPTGDTEKSGDFAAITNDGTNLYTITSSGQVFRSTDGSSWDYIDSVSENPSESSAAVFTDSTDTKYLLIGTNDGYFELNLSETEASVVGPTETASTSDPQSFEAAYPDLAQSMVFDIWVSSADDVFYLATENGLWQRTSSEDFRRQ